MDILTLSKKMPIPDWGRGNRYEALGVLDLWLDGKQYNHMPFAFSEENEKGGGFRKMYDRRPSVRLNLPMLGAKLASRKLFAGKHGPRLVHKDEKMQEALIWLEKTAKIHWHMLGAVKQGQSGSVALTFAIVDDETPVVNVWAGKDCWPEFDDADKLTKLTIAYVVDGRKWLQLHPEFTSDGRGNPVLKNSKYWFIRVYDQEDIMTWLPIEEADWNPVEGFEDEVMLSFLKTNDKLKEAHNAGFLPALWIRNQPNGNQIDGESSFGESPLSNCIHIDYTLSQLGRGINYMGAPQLMVKGRILNYEKAWGNVHIFGPAHMLNLPPDRVDAGGGGISGADAKMIEMDGTGIAVGMEKWVERIKTWTLELMSTSRKDPNNINGALSGKAIELLDEDFIDFIQTLRTAYGAHGVLEAMKILCLMLIAVSHPKLKGVTEDTVDETELEWPRLYSPDPEEVKQLVEAATGAIAGGLLDAPDGVDWFQASIDVRSDKATGEPIPEEPPEGVPAAPSGGGGGGSDKPPHTKVTVTVPGAGTITGGGAKKPKAKPKK